MFCSCPRGTYRYEKQHATFLWNYETHLDIKSFKISSKFLFSSKATVMFFCTLSLSVFLSLLKSATLGFYCIFPSSPIYNMAKYYTSCIIFFVTSLVLLQSRTFSCMQRKETFLEEHLVQRLHVSHLLTLSFLYKDSIFSWGKKKNSSVRMISIF